MSHENINGTHSNGKAGEGPPPDAKPRQTAVERLAAEEKKLAALQEKAERTKKKAAQQRVKVSREEQRLLTGQAIAVGNWIRANRPEWFDEARAQLTAPRDVDRFAGAPLAVDLARAKGAAANDVGLADATATLTPIPDPADAQVLARDKPGKFNSGWLSKSQGNSVVRARLDEREEGPELDAAATHAGTSTTADQKGPEMESGDRTVSPHSLTPQANALGSRDISADPRTPSNLAYELPAVRTVPESNSHLSRLRPNKFRRN